MQRHQCGQKTGGGGREGKCEVKVVMVTGTEGLGAELISSLLRLLQFIMSFIFNVSVVLDFLQVLEQREMCRL